jgi:hypothetical protein
MPRASAIGVWKTPKRPERIVREAQVEEDSRMSEYREKLVKEEPKKRKTWLIVVIVLVVLCCLIVVCGGGGYLLYQYGDVIFEWVARPALLI